MLKVYPTGDYLRIVHYHQHFGHGAPPVYACTPTASSVVDTPRADGTRRSSLGNVAVLPHHQPCWVS